MTPELRFCEFYPHPIDAVWAAITEPAALAAWLMPNDFEATVGKRFTLHSMPAPGQRGWIDGELLELEPPRRMVWSWRSAAEQAAGRVEFQLRPVAGGTELTLVHSGEPDREWRSRYSAGWPGKLDQLRARLSQDQADNQ